MINWDRSAEEDICHTLCTVVVCDFCFWYYNGELLWSFCQFKKQNIFLTWSVYHLKCIVVCENPIKNSHCATLRHVLEYRNCFEITNNKIQWDGTTVSARHMSENTRMRIYLLKDKDTIPKKYIPNYNKFIAHDLGNNDTFTIDL